MVNFFCQRLIVFLLLLVVFFSGFFVWADSNNSPPSAKNYAPNFWFDSDERYYPVNPLDFYFENGLEISGELAVEKYDRLSFEQKINHFTVFYHIYDSGDEFVYQFWFFYIFNDFEEFTKNKHYGDWEAVFVFVDKDSRKINKVIGTAHQRKLFDTEIYNPKNNHIWTYVGKGSHANCVDDEGDGKCEHKRWKYVEDWNAKGGKFFGSDYRLQEIDIEFIKSFKGERTLKFSPDVSPFGGSPPNHPWAQTGFYNPDELRPISAKYIAEYVSDSFKGVKNKVAGVLDSAFDKITSFFKGSDKRQEAGLAYNLFPNEPLKKEILPEDSSISYFFNSPQSKAEDGQGDKDKNTLPIASNANPLPEEDKAKKNDKKDNFSGGIEVRAGDLAHGPIENQASDEISSQIEKIKPVPPVLPDGFLSGGGAVKEHFKDKQDEPDNKNVIDDVPSEEKLDVDLDEEKEKRDEDGEEIASSTDFLLASPSVISPENGSIFGPDDDFSSSTSEFEIYLAGTSSPGYLINIFVNSTSTLTCSTTTDEKGRWFKEVVLTGGASSVFIQAEMDSDYSDYQMLDVFVDLKGPLDVSDLRAEIGVQRGSLELSWSAPYDDGSSGQAEYYIIKYATSSEKLISEWDKALKFSFNMAPGTASTSEKLLVDGLIPGEKYYWALKSIDYLGNVSEISNIASTTASAIAEHVVINEVQLGANEFIELYNPTSQDIDMTGWYFAYYPNTRRWASPYLCREFPVGAIIPAQGHYLIGLAGFSGNLYLEEDWSPYSSSRLNDKKGSIAIFPWNPKERSEEEDIAKGVIDALGWGSVAFVYEGDESIVSSRNRSLKRFLDGWDSDNNEDDFIEILWPSPINSQGDKATLIYDNARIKENAVWEKENSPYILFSNKGQYPTIESGAILEIEPGTVVKSQSKYYLSLLVKGALRAKGENGNHIIFTSLATSTDSGQWTGVVFDGADSGGSLLKNVFFENGGAESSYQLKGDLTAMINAKNSVLEINNCSFNNSENKGLEIFDSSVSVSNSIFDGNKTGIYAQGSNLEAKINNSSFKNHSDCGIWAGESSLEIFGNVFEKNHYPIYFRSAYPSFSNNQVRENDVNGAVVSDLSIFSQDASWSADLPYIMLSNKGNWPTIASGTVFAIEEGATIKSHNKYYTSLGIEGELIALGTKGKPIVFTSFKDDLFGGDSNNDGSGSEANPEDWKNIRFEAGSKGELDYLYFRYGGYDASSPVYIDSSAVVDYGQNNAIEH